MVSDGTWIVEKPNIWPLENFKSTRQAYKCMFDDYFKYETTRMGSISLQIPLGDIFELNGVLNVPGLTKNFLSVLVMTNL